MADDKNDAPGAPGIPPTWTSSAKDVVGCSLGHKYPPDPQELKAALDKTTNSVPVDIDPITAFGENVR